MGKIHAGDYAELEKAINQKLRKVGRGYGIRNLYRTPQGRYRFEMTVSVDPRDEAKWRAVVREVLRGLPGDRPMQAKHYLPASIVGRVKAEAAKKGMSRSAIVAECLSARL